MQRKTKKAIHKLLSVVLSAAMVLTGITVPAETAKAQEDRIDLSAYMTLSGTTEKAQASGSEKPSVDVFLSMPQTMDEKGELDALGVKDLVIKVKAASFTSYSDTSADQAGALAFFMSKAWEWYDGGSWTALRSNETVTLSMDMTSATWGGDTTIGKIGLQFTNLAAESTVSYEISEIYFTTGAGGSSGGGGTQTDTTTDLNLDIEYNFAKLLQESLYFYDANMCGNEVDENGALSWRGDCHTYDSRVSYTNAGGNVRTIDVSGGFHDAGDHVKFGLPQGYAASVLALSYYKFGDAYDELGQTAHLNTIMDYFCDYFTRCTVYQAGSTDVVEAFCYQVGEGISDHAIWSAPETQTLNRPAYFATASNPATDEVSVAAAALAIMAMNYQKQGGEQALAKSEAYLKTAKDLFAFAKNVDNKQVATEGAAEFYNSSGWKDDYCTAAAALYLATGDSLYAQELSSYYGEINTGWCLSWDNTWPIAAVLKDDWTSAAAFASYGTTVTAQGFKLIDGWGSARYNAGEQFMGLMCDQKAGKLNLTEGNYCSWATGQMKYLLGNNQAKRCFVVGYNENAAKYPHHRAASNSSDAGQTSENHYTLLGALVGGPSDVNDTYADNQADYNCNEVALDYNAGLVGAAAGLCLLHKKNADYPAGLATADELSAIGVTKYYGNTGDDSGNTGDDSGNTGDDSGNTGDDSGNKDGNNGGNIGGNSENNGNHENNGNNAPEQNDNINIDEESEARVGDTVPYDDQEYTVLEIKDGKVYVSLTDADPDSTDVSIPASYQTESGEVFYVTQIAANAFANCKKLKTVKIANGITKIGKKAFYKCIRLKNLSLPDSLLTIGESAFEGCSSLTKLVLPKNVKSVGKKAFYQCKKLGSITFQTTKLKTAGSLAFCKIKNGAVIKLPKKKYGTYRKLLRKKYDGRVRWKKA